MMKQFSKYILEGVLEIEDKSKNRILKLKIVMLVVLIYIYVKKKIYIWNETKQMIEGKTESALTFVW